MADWGDAFRQYVQARHGELPPADWPVRFAWVRERHEIARDILQPQTLETMPPEVIYKRLQALSLPGCPIGVTKLGKANDAPQVVDALWRLMTTPGDFAEKFRAAKIPQAGFVTVSELLGLAKPHRFVIRNTVFTRALLQVVPFYTLRGLRELDYEEFLDTCRELARVLLEFVSGGDLRQWVETHRFLLLYAVLLDNEPK